MLGDTNLNQINELKRNQTNENQEQRSKNRGVEIQLKSLKEKEGPAAT